MGVALLVRDARWLAPDGTFSQGHVAVEDGHLRLLRPDEVLPQGAPMLNGAESLVLPGAIDAHTHFRQPGQAYKEGILSGSRAALKGGVTTVLDMPNTVPPTTPGRLGQKRKLFAWRSLVNWGLHVLVLPGLNPPPLPHASGKIYMAKSSIAPAVRGEALAGILARWPRVTVHAEDEMAFASSGAAPHHRRRPRSAIIRALRALDVALESGGDAARARVVICHVSTAEEVQWIRRRKAQGFDVWGETCPHYLLLTQDDYLRRGALLQVNPPLREASDRLAILQGLAEGVIDFVSSDHAPHTPAEKTSPQALSGVPGIEWLIPSLLHVMHTGGLSWKRFHGAICAAQSTCYSIRRRDGIIPGNAADLVLVRPSSSPGVGRVITKAGYDPFEGVPLGWTVQATVVNGRIMYRDGVLTGSARGREVVG